MNRRIFLILRFLWHPQKTLYPTKNFSIFKVYVPALITLGGPDSVPGGNASPRLPGNIDNRSISLKPQEGKSMKYLPYKEKLDKCYSAVLMDVMDTMNVRVQCMDPSVKPLVPAMRTWGEVVTVYVETVTEIPEKPYEIEMEVIDDLKEGQIIVAQCNAPELSAFWGGLLSNAAVGRKSPGVITDGGARDYREIVSLNFPVFCKGLSPYDSLGRMDGKERNIPIVCGGIRVKPGDLVYGDVDGVVVVPQEMAPEVISRAWEKVRGENTVREELRAGASVAKTFEKYGIL